MMRESQGILVKMKTLKLKASLTVEAALVLPIFLYLMIAFLYFIQIFTIQEQIQTAITKMGLTLSKAAYFYKDFPDINEAICFDKSIFGSDIDVGLSDITDNVMSGGMLELYAKKYLDTAQINRSCIMDGFKGISFLYSSITNDQDKIDIVARYQVHIPVKIFNLGEITLLQRATFRAWTGYEVAAVYSTKDENVEESMVYVTDTGSVYHKDKNCSHIKLSIKEVQGIPVDLRNDSGAKYYPCEACCSGKEDETAVYYNFRWNQISLKKGLPEVKTQHQRDTVVRSRRKNTM
jgi:hypothetical protein